MQLFSPGFSFLLLLLLYPAVTGIANAAAPENAVVEDETREIDESKLDDIRSGSGEVTIIETAAGTRFKTIDSNNDGYVTVPEWAGSNVRADFNEVDADGNGIIERAELGNASASSPFRAQGFGGSSGDQAATRSTANAQDPDGMTGDGGCR